MGVIDFKQEDERSRRSSRCVGVYKGETRMGQIDVQLNGTCTFRNGGFQRDFVGMSTAKDFIKSRYEPDYQAAPKLSLSPEECIELDKGIRQRMATLDRLEVAANITVEEVIEAGLEALFPYAANRKPMMERVRRVVTTTIMRSCGHQIPQVFDRRPRNNPLLPEGAAQIQQAREPISIMPDARPQRVFASTETRPAAPALGAALADAARQVRARIEPPPAAPEPVIQRAATEPQPEIPTEPERDEFGLLPLPDLPATPPPAPVEEKPAKTPVRRRRNSPLEPKPPVETPAQRRARKAQEIYERTRASLFKDPIVEPEPEPAPPPVVETVVEPIAEVAVEAVAEAIPQAPRKLTSADCKAIRKQLYAGATTAAVAAEWGIARPLVGRIHSGSYTPSDTARKKK